MAAPAVAPAPVLGPSLRLEFAGNKDAWRYLSGTWRDWGGRGALAPAQRAGLQFSAPGLAAGAVLRLWGRGNTRAANVPQTVRVLVNGVEAATMVIPEGTEVRIDVPLTAHPDGNYLLDLFIAEAGGPFVPHPTRDEQPLGLWLTAIELLPPGD